jgi:N-acetylmuramoyl-L-alanine amidase
MDEKVLKLVTVLSGVLTIAVCLGLFYFPMLANQSVFAVEQSPELGTGKLVAASANPVEVVEETDETFAAQLKIGLPTQLSEKELTIENDYVTQTVYIRFAGGSDNYFDEYEIKGNCDHIDSLSYYKDGTDGVIALELDRVYELQQTYEQGSLYLDFLDPHEVYDKVVVIDAGHGGKVPGAVKLGVEEKDIDLAIVLKLKKLFDAGEDNIGVYYTRTTDTNPTLSQRVELANRSDADIFISVHNNSESNGNFTKTNGTQVMYSESDDSSLSSKKLAQICLDNVTESLGSRARELLEGDDIYIIRTSKVPVALIEVGFMTNYEELEKLQTQKYQKAAAKGIYNAIMEAFQEGY